MQKGSDLYGASGVFIVQTFPVGSSGYIKTDVAYSEGRARALVAAQRNARTYVVNADGADRTCEAGWCSIWEIQASNGGRGPLVTGFRKVGDWEFDGLGGAQRVDRIGQSFAPAGSLAERALAQRPRDSATQHPDTTLE